MSTKRRRSSSTPTSEGRKKQKTPKPTSSVGFFGSIFGGQKEDESPRKSNHRGARSLVGVMAQGAYGALLRSLQDLPLLDINTLIKLPCIVVIGAESHGKSSVLERIALQSFFPRAEALCTRMPILLSLKHDPTATKNTPVTIRLVKTTKNGEEKEELSREEAALADIPGRVRTIMRETVAKKNGRHRKTPVGIVEDHQLVIVMRKPDVPTLDLIDLPGIVAGRKEGEPNDIDKQTERLATNYCRDFSPLVLCVVAASSEHVRNERATLIVQKLKAESRTVCVLTKTDHVTDSQRQKRIVDRIKNCATDLPQGIESYVAVKNRSTEVEASGTTVQEAAKLEEDWFAEEFPDLDPASEVTANALISKLDAMLSTHIRTNWVPKAIVAVEKYVEKLKRQIRSFGSSRPSSREVLGQFRGRVHAKLGSLEDVVRQSCKVEFDLSFTSTKSLRARVEGKRKLKAEVAGCLEALDQEAQSILAAVVTSSALPFYLSRFPKLKTAVLFQWDMSLRNNTLTALKACQAAVDLAARKLLSLSELQGALAEALWEHICEAYLELLVDDDELVKNMEDTIGNFRDLKVKDLKELAEESEEHSRKRRAIEKEMEKCKDSLAILQPLLLGQVKAKRE